MEKTIKFRAVIEVLGQPKEHVEEALKGYLANLKENEDYELLSEDFAEIKQQEDLWATFAEVEIATEKLGNIVNFCFDYMPSLLEVLEPSQIIYTNEELSPLLNDLMAKLHSVDMVAKQFRLENQHLLNDAKNLLKNYITVLLRQKNLTAKELSGLTGVVQERLEDFLDELIDEGKVDLKEGIYFLTTKNE